ncbi:MAG TPA: hypothetical protein VFH58_07240 [Acidimicrobiales bacterium]|nr:hypothetical protein [Acidimicrobiales bacterium]
MRRLFTPAAAVLGLVAIGSAACGSSGSTNAASTSTTSGANAKKTAFCNANKTLDKASSSVNTSADFLAVLKANASTLATLKANLPPGKVGAEASALVEAANNAVATNNPNALFNPSLRSDGGDVDTYCGTDGSGDPLPPYFGAGKSTAFCSVNDQINAGTESAQSGADTLTFLAAHQDLVNQFANDVPGLPSSIRSQAQTLVTTARQAIATKNGDLLNTQAIGTDAMNVSLYCGQNQ